MIPKNLAAFFLRKRTAYKRVFNDKNIDVHVVLTDLRKFCPTDATYKTGSDINEKLVYINIGRRQVLSRIMSMINMSDDRINEIAEMELKENTYGPD